jgi:hypothetical protein
MAKKETTITQTEPQKPGTILAATETAVTVQMEEGTPREFSKARRLQKVSSVLEDGSVAVDFFFINGAVRRFVSSPNDALHSKFVAHGIEAKFGDAANAKNPKTGAAVSVEEAVEILDKLAIQIKEGTWNAGRSESSAPRHSELNDILKAVATVIGKSIEDLEARIAQQVEAGLSKSRTAYLNSVAENSAIAEEILRIKTARKPASATVAADLLAGLN